MKKYLIPALILASYLLLMILQINCAPQEKKELTKEEMVKRGRYLVNFGGCNDCHSPKVFTQMGPVPDTTRLLSGHPAGTPLSAIDTSITGSKWMYSSMDLTAWVGPWGVSFPANLTPDGATGIGNWTDEIFIKAMRTGKHMGFGRPILPPMPWQSLAGLEDEDLKAILAYLKSLPPISNQVPDPIPPNMIAQTINKK